MTALPTSVLTDRLLAFLSPARYATIATLNPDGTPHQAVTWYLVEDDELILNSRRSRRWPHNLLVNPAISLAIQDRDDPEHWIGLKGFAGFRHDGPPAFEDIAAMARRYGSDPERFRGQDRISFTVRVERAFEYEG